MAEGVWRTIGGRRVYIKDGQSVSDAMKESGKFNKKGKKADEPEKETSAKNGLKDKLDSEKQIEKEFPYNFSEEVEHQAHMINARSYDDIDDVVDDFAEEQGITPREAKYALLKDEFKTRQKLYEDARKDGSYSDSQLNHMESMAKDSYFKLQEAQEELDSFNKENEFEKSIKEGYETFHGKTDKEAVEIMEKDPEKYGKEKISEADLKKANEMNKMLEKEKQDVYESKVYGSDVKKADEEMKKTFGEDFKYDENPWEKTAREYVAKLEGLTEQQQRMIEMKRSGQYKDLLGPSDEKSVREAIDRLTNENKNPSKPNIEYSEYNRQIDKENERRAKEYKENADWIRNAFAQYKKEHPNTKKKLSDFKK